VSVSLQHRLEYYALKGTLGVLRLLPLGAARTFAEWVGVIGYWPLGIRRRVVVRQIAAAFPAYTAAEVRRVARRAYRNLARVTVELPLVAARGREVFHGLFESTEDFTPVRRQYEAGKGVILVSGHFGNWELAGAYSPMVGFPVDVIVRGQSNPLVDRWVNETRTALGMTPVHDADAVRRIPRAFREGRAVGFVADQGVLGLASTFVPFFGRPAKTPRGPAVFALKYGLPIWFLGAVKTASGKYHLLVREIAVAQTGDRDADVDQTMANFNQVLEACVREYPDQYFWHHRRWRRQPPGTPPELADPT
jgi:KDO2-lipid IV(A) lauroyltransferase